TVPCSSVSTPFAAHLSVFALQAQRPFLILQTPHSQISTLSLHDALPISPPSGIASRALVTRLKRICSVACASEQILFNLVTNARSEEHTSELQSRRDLVCRLLLKKKQNTFHRGK